MDRSIEQVPVSVRILPHGEGLELPCYQTEQAAGMDLLAAVEGPVELLPGGRMLVPSGLSIALPPGWEAQIRPRSGLAMKSGVTVLNAPGTIDADYRGEVGVLLVNLSQESFLIRRGDRIAQMVIARVAQGQWVRVQVLPESQRGSGGFGHTGL